MRKLKDLLLVNPPTEITEEERKIVKEKLTECLCSDRIVFYLYCVHAPEGPESRAEGLATLIVDFLFPKKGK
jgi:hypothetical protein